MGGQTQASARQTALNQQLPSQRTTLVRTEKTIVPAAMIHTVNVTKKNADIASTVRDETTALSSIYSAFKQEVQDISRDKSLIW